MATPPQSAPPPAKRQRTEELRIDPSDGQAYPLSSFTEVYGPEEGQKLWESATPAETPVAETTPVAEPTPESESPAANVPVSTAVRRKVHLPPAGRIRTATLSGPVSYKVYGPPDPNAPKPAPPQPAPIKQPPMQPSVAQHQQPWYPNALTHYPEGFGAMPLTSRVMLLGEGNFSLSMDLLAKLRAGRIPGTSLICTAYDSAEECVAKYPEVEGHYRQLQNYGIEVHHGIDATDAGTLQQAAPGGVDAVVFHFPHTGDKQHFHWNPGPELIQKSIDNNVNLLRGYFKAVATWMPTAYTFVTLKTNQPYCFWGLELQAAREGWVLKQAIPFNPQHFPKYSHRRTLPNQNKKPNAKPSSVKMNDAVCHQFVLDPPAAARRVAELPDAQALQHARMGRPPPASCAPPTEGEEIRMDPKDGRYYTLRDFQVCYGGLTEWEAAEETSTIFSASRFS